MHVHVNLNQELRIHCHDKYSDKYGEREEIQVSVLFLFFSDCAEGGGGGSVAAWAEVFL